MTLKPARSRAPNQPAAPHSMMSETPTTMGDTANGRSTTAWSSPRPRNRPRTSARAVATPKTTLTGTMMATMSSDRLSADWAAGVEIEAMNSERPGEKVRQRMTPIGTPSRTKR